MKIVAKSTPLPVRVLVAVLMLGIVGETVHVAFGLVDDTGVLMDVLYNGSAGRSAPPGP